MFCEVFVVCFVVSLVSCFVFVVKMPRNKPLTPEGRELLLSVVDYFTRERNNGGPLRSVLAVQQRVADCLDVHVNTVKKVVASRGNDEDMNKKIKRLRRHSRSLDVPEAVKTEVRNVVYWMYAMKIIITMSELLRQVVIEKQIWDFKRTSLWQLVKSLGFRFRKTNYRVGLCEQSHVVTMRQKFLKDYVANLDSATPLDVPFWMKREFTVKVSTLY